MAKRKVNYQFINDDVTDEVKKKVIEDAKADLDRALSEDVAFCVMVYTEEGVMLHTNGLESDLVEFAEVVIQELEARRLTRVDLALASLLEEKPVD